MEQVLPGVWKVTVGEPETLTPVTLRHRAPADAALAALPDVRECPLSAMAIQGKRTARGYVVQLPLLEDEQVYGLGLQLLSFNQRGLKKTLRVNSDPQADLGDSHAPVPFYVTTQGYGVFIDTARYATFYFGQAHPRDSVPTIANPATNALAEQITGSAETMYATHTTTLPGQVYVEIPAAAGVDIYIFAGPTLTHAVQRYNLFSGGGCLPPRWGLGVWYRPRLDFDHTQAVALADSFRADTIPCDVLGLEPGWQTHTYSCTYMWSDKFPDPAALVREMAARHVRLNLWEHVFIHPEAPIYQAMLPYSGDFLVWGGLVPDLTIPEARRIFARFQEETHVMLGISGYKLDECDSSDYIHPQWSFPELESFPSGLDGEQYHSLLGINYQETLYGIFRGRNQRTYNEVRSAHALAAPYPFVLYSDLYNHADFLRGVVNEGFSGLLWCPEVRHAESEEDLIRRLQSVIFSPQALVNGWYIKNAPWKQWRTEENNNDLFLPNADELTAACRAIFALRMALIPYLYAAFARYALEGLPPFRALVMDYPDDAHVWKIDTQYMVGDRLMVAPVTAGTAERDIYLPEGVWFDFDTGERLDGGRTITMATPREKIPVFVKGEALLPMAYPVQHTDDPRGFELTVRVYGNGSVPIRLFEDDGVTFDFEQGDYNLLRLTWDAVHNLGMCARTREKAPSQYTVTAWQKMG